MQEIYYDNSKLLEFIKTYKVHNSELLTIKMLTESENIQIRRYKQQIYFGEITNNKRCGKGIMIYNNGRVYEGEWLNDFKFGKGYELYPTGNRYEG